MSTQADHHRLPKRSASHGTLRSSYATHSGSVSAQPPFRPLHKPLRSVNENTVLLPSPGALESMLKTTTETGDIGIFSIKPVSSPKRGTLSDLGQLPHPPALRPVDSLYGRGARYRLPGSRDTTSEILSMYTSGSQRSVTSTLSPTSTEDTCPRSFSMTTCGSRHLSHHKSTATLQSHGSGAPLQRPRSPFPYPTRLKRPGVRPASPALTETGHVDYSRMVEIDRISLRTIHGPYKPFYPHGARRPIPLRVRANSNLALSCVPGQHTYPGRSLQWSSRSPSAISMTSWSGSPRSPLDNDPRSSSLTSLVSMYQKMPLGLQSSSSSLPAPPPRYYDYTEEFEPRLYGTPPRTAPGHYMVSSPQSVKQPQDIFEKPGPLFSPTYDRRGSAFFETESPQPDLEEETIPTDVLDDSYPEAHHPDSLTHYTLRASPAFSGVSESPHKRQRQLRASDIDLLPSQIGRDSMDTFNPTLDVESKDTTAHGYNKFCMAETPQATGASPGRQVEVQVSKPPTIHSEQGVILRDEPGDEFLVDTPPLEMENIGLLHDGQCSERRTFSLPGTCRDTPGSVRQIKQSSNFHRYATVNTHLRVDPPSPESNTTSTDTALNGDSLPSPSLDSDQIIPNDPSAPKKSPNGRQSAETPEKTSLPPLEASLVRFRRHKRNLAALRISTSNLLKGVNEGYPHLTPSCSTAPLLAPKPISPARQLKVKNSIPRLMKALPPLPGDPGYAMSAEHNAIEDDDDFLEILAPFSLSRALAPRGFRKTGPSKPELAAVEASSTTSLPSPPKLKVKLKSTDRSLQSNSKIQRALASSDPTPSGTLNSSPSSHAFIHGSKSDLATPRRLKIRTARSTGSHSPVQSTVRRDPTRESDIGASLAQLPQNDLFSGGGASSHQASANRSGTASTNDQRGIRSTNDTKGSSKGWSRRTPKWGLKGGDCALAVGPRQPHRLRKRLSNMKTLLVGSSEHQGDPSGNSTSKSELVYDEAHLATDDNITLRSAKTTKSEALYGSSSSPYTHKAPMRRRVRVRLTKWVKEAKSAVRSYAKKSHSL